MAVTYEFKNIDEFVSYLDIRAKNFRKQASLVHKRSHEHARASASAAQIESIAAMVRSSNLVVVTDFMRAALSKGVA